MSPEARPDIVFPSPEQWGGHHFDDTCGSSDISNTSLLLGLGEYITNKKLLISARQLINKYLTNPNHIPIRSFKYGEVFDGSIYPHGTIIRYELAKISYKLGQEPEQSKDIFWGVVMEDTMGEEKIASIVSYKQDDMVKNRANLLSGTQLDPVINIGVTDHQRESDRGNTVFQSLERVDWLQRMSLGMGISIAMPHKARVVFHHQPVAA